jgi:hypothetical protein
MLIDHLSKWIVMKFCMLIDRLCKTIILDVNWSPLQDYYCEFWMLIDYLSEVIVLTSCMLNDYLYKIIAR